LQNDTCGKKARRLDRALTLPSEFPPDLTRVVGLWPKLPESLRLALGRWPELPEPIRAAVLALVGTVPNGK
jgi:hypothetical protein